MSALPASPPTPLIDADIAPEAAPAMLRLQNIESSYGPVKAIRGVSLQVRQGEIATVLGSNGAGKTTILKTISGIIDPRKGQVHFMDADITARDPPPSCARAWSMCPRGARCSRC